MTTPVRSRQRRSSPWFQVAGVVVVAALAALSWYGWMAWDSQYQVDPVTHAETGPYEAWQVVGCVLSLLVVFVGALLAGVRPRWASAALTLAFTAAWTATAAPDDETGTYGVGTIMVLVGLVVATTVVALAVQGLRRLWSPRRPAPRLGA